MISAISDSSELLRADKNSSMYPKLVDVANRMFTFEHAEERTYSEELPLRWSAVSFDGFDEVLKSF